ncbi:hypothetical protein B0I35DRAFT_479304 [Stachybotrys elegans]|uniref:Zn(2)-C6 fungal-type domain-containing protein n=1 Tax=Stachybotrys elegans TaxID=80388 RepID=A0A8K0SPJ1_9HYPO|nr:hypothetical protein B0I35DRAFT_479304 [Stachybotrys elegans]
MGLQSLPSPPAEEAKSAASRKASASSSSSLSVNTKMGKPAHRISKRATPTAAAAHSHDHHHGSNQLSHGGVDGRHKRVWKACERCRMKKTKCDGEFPCKRCKDDGLVCTAGVRKKMEYKQLPRGYAEVLENTQFALIATVHKLYSMVRNQQPWELGEPELNDRGQPVIHNIAQKLGCIRPNSDIDLPVHSVFPEDEAGMAELARQLEEQQKETGTNVESSSMMMMTSSSSSSSKRDLMDSDSLAYQRNDRDSSSELDHSDLEQDYRKAAFGGSNVVTLSPQSFTTTSTDFDFGGPGTGGPGDMDTSMMFPSLSPPVPSFSPWSAPAGPQGDGGELAMHFMQQAGALQSMDMLSQGLMESDFGTIKPHVLSSSNAGVMMGMGDPMIYSGYEDDSMRL